MFEPKKLCAATFERQIAAMSGYNQQLKTSFLEFRCKIEPEVDALFEAARAFACFLEAAHCSRAVRTTLVRVGSATVGAASPPPLGGLYSAL